MRRIKPILILASVVLLAFLCCFLAFAENTFSRANIGTVTERDNMSGFELSSIVKTADMRWTLSDGILPHMRTEKGLPSYVLTDHSDTFTGAFYSTPVSPLDMYFVKKISFVFKMSDQDNAVNERALFILTLASEGKILECTGEVTSGRWNVITFDISGWKHRKHVTAISVQIVGADGTLPLGNIELSGPYAPRESKPEMAKFMSEWLSAPGTEIEFLNRGEADEALRINLRAKRLSLSGVAHIPYSEETKTALRIILSNDSGLTSVRFSYNYLDTVGGGYASDTKNIDLKPMSGKTSYIINTCDVSLISSFSFVFDSAGAGSVTLHSIEPVAVYGGADLENEFYGEIIKCSSDKSGKLITVSGSVHHSYLISHTEDKLLCYMLAGNESFGEAIESGRKPVGEINMSSKFSFELKVKELEGLPIISKFAVAAISSEGELTLIASPASVEESTGVPDTSMGKVNIKGLEYDFISMATYCGVGNAIVDVYLDKLTSSNQSGHIYSTKDTFVFFDTEYVSELDTAIKNLYAEGCRIYLRLLISPNADSEHLQYTLDSTSDTSPFFAFDTSSADGEKEFYATVDFLAKRYSGSGASGGKLTGLILGKSIDLSPVYNSSRENNIVSYAKKTARALEIMACTASASIPGIEIVLPVSDGRGEDKNGFDTELLLASIGKYLDDGGGMQYSLMLESTHAPYSGNVDGKKAPSDMNSNYYCADNLSEFENMLKQLSKYSESVPSAYIYHWTPDLHESETEISAEYIYNYYSVMFSEMSSAFVLSLPSTEDGRKSAAGLSYLMKFIDTTKNITGSLCLSALTVFDAESWKDIVPSFDDDKIVYRNFYEVKPFDMLPDNIKGRYSLWDFSNAFGTLDWLSGSGCDSLQLEGASNGGKALCAELYTDGSVSSYSDIVYRFEYPEKVTLMPYLGFELSVDDGGAGNRYEIMIVVGGNGHRIESKRLIVGGRTENIYVSTFAMSELSEMDQIRICVRAVDAKAEDADVIKLRLNSVTAYSDRYGNSGLADRIEKARAIARNADVAEDKADNGDVTHDLLVVAIAVIIPAVALVAFYDRKQK